MLQARGLSPGHLQNPPGGPRVLNRPLPCNGPAGTLVPPIELAVMLARHAQSEGINQHWTHLPRSILLPL